MRLSSSSGIIKLPVAALGLAASAAIAGQASGPKPIGNPAEFFGASNYPPEARRANQQGRVEAGVAVGADGKPTGCRVIVSSASDSLDQKTCDIAIAKMQFEPAHDAEGQVIASNYQLKVRWAMRTAGTLSMVKFHETAQDTTCTARIDGAARQINGDYCHTLVAAIRKNGGSLDQPFIAQLPDLPSVLVPLDTAKK